MIRLSWLKQRNFSFWAVVLSVSLITIHYALYLIIFFFPLHFKTRWWNSTKWLIWATRQQQQGWGSPRPRPWTVDQHMHAQESSFANTSICLRTLESYMFQSAQESSILPLFWESHECNMAPLLRLLSIQPLFAPPLGEKRGIKLGKSMVASGCLLTAAFATIVFFCSALQT